jgi:hypothetical protein
MFDLALRFCYLYCLPLGLQNNLSMLFKFRSLYNVTRYVCRSFPFDLFFLPTFFYVSESSRNKNAVRFLFHICIFHFSFLIFCFAEVLITVFFCIFVFSSLPLTLEKNFLIKVLRKALFVLTFCDCILCNEYWSKSYSYNVVKAKTYQS